MKFNANPALCAMDSAQSRASKYPNSYQEGRHREKIDWSSIPIDGLARVSGAMPIMTKSICFDCLPVAGRTSGYGFERFDETLVSTPPSPEALLVPWKQHRAGRATVAYGPSTLQLHRESGWGKGRIIIAGQLTASTSSGCTHVDLAPDPGEWSPILLKALLEEAKIIIIEQRHRHVDDALFRIHSPSDSVRILAAWQSTAKWIWTARAFADQAGIEVRSFSRGKTMREFLP